MSTPHPEVIETGGALILGAGVAGLFTALKLAPFPALVLANGRPGASGSSAWAQGGIAAAVGADDDWRTAKNPSHEGMGLERLSKLTGRRPCCASRRRE